MPKLWDYFNGEPFLVNPHLAVFSPNPKRKTKGKTKAMARYIRKRKTTRRRRARRNAYPVGGLVLNPRRRRHSVRRRRARRNPAYLSRPIRRRMVMNKRRRRSSYRRNPAILGIQLPALSKIAFAGVGYFAPPIVEGFISQWLPVEMQTSTLGKYAVKIGSVIGLSFLVKQVLGAEEAKMTAIGGGVYIVKSALIDFAPSLAHTLGLAGYTQPGSPMLGTYTNGSQPAYTGMGQLPQGSFPGALTTRVPTRFDRF